MTPEEPHQQDFFEVASDTVTLRLVEETVSVARHRSQTDRVRISTHTETRQEILHEILAGETLTVERQAVEYRVEAPPPLREEGDVTIFSVVEERAVITRALFVVEEIHVRRAIAATPVVIPVDLRRQHAVVEQDAPATPHRFQDPEA